MLYPEQNEARLKLSLDGTWAFALGSCAETQFDPAKPLPDAQPIAVPASYNDQNDQTTALRRHYGWVWYQRKVTLPAFCAGQRVVLRFGSVTHTAKVWLNGQLIAQHKGGFTPFEADVTALLQPDETALLTVACDNRVNHSTLPVGNEDGQLAFFGSDNAGIPSVEAAKRAAAPQNRPNFDFFNYAGIHRPVVLYTTPKEYIEDVTIVPAVDGTVQYAVKTTGSALSVSRCWMLTATPLQARECRRHDHHPGSASLGAQTRHALPVHPACHLRGRCLRPDLWCAQH